MTIHGHFVDLEEIEHYLKDSYPHLDITLSEKEFEKIR
jgi:hypothetical protein